MLLNFTIVFVIIVLFVHFTLQYLANRKQLKQDLENYEHNKQSTKDHPHHIKGIKDEFKKK